MAPRWSQRVVHFLTTAEVVDIGDDALEQAEFLSAISRFQLISSHLYYLFDDGILRLVVPPEHTVNILCKQQKPMPFVTLYAVMATPDWAEHVIRHLTTREYPKDMSKHRMQWLDAQCQGHKMIGGQIYKQGYDDVLRFCVCRPEYISILQNVHVGVGGGHFSGPTTAK